MRTLPFLVCLSSLATSMTALAADPAPNPGAAPKAPPGLSQPLAAGPFTYRTGEGFDIRVTVLARVTSPYGIAFLPDGEMLVTTRRGELKRMAKGSSTLEDVPGGPKSIVPTTAGVHGYMSLAVHPQFAQNRTVYLIYTKPMPENRRVNAVARARYVDGKLEGATDIFVGDFNSTGPAAVAMTRDAKLYVALTGGFGKVAQDPMSLAGKVLRLNDDGSVPKDNPFVGKDGFRPEILHDGPSHRARPDRAAGDGRRVHERDGSQRRR